MTSPRRDGNHASPFLAWIRECAGLDSQEFQLSVINNDVWIHRFSQRNESTRPIKRLIEHIQLIEEKSFSADMPFAQRDTLQVVDLILRRSSVKANRRWPIRIPDMRFGRAGCFRDVRWLGMHLVQLSADRPDNSDRIIWDGKHQINEQVLIEILRFDRDPDHPNRFLDTRRHHVRPAREMHPHLAFDSGNHG